MLIRINGREETVPDTTDTITALLEFLNIQARQTAVEVNGAVIEHNSFAATKLHNGDTIEIVSFVGGG